jgi:hypothetical protein
VTRYPEMLGHIYLHQNFLEKSQNRPFNFEEAAADWYDNVFRPAVTLIRKYSILEHYPDRTEGDLYLWMVDHLREVSEELGEDATSRSFSDALVDFLREHKIPIPSDLLVEDDPTVSLTRSEVMRQVQERMNRREGD